LAKVRSLIVDLWAYHENQRGLFKRNGELPNSFLQSLSFRLFELKRITCEEIDEEKPSNKRSTCDYHQHRPDPELCYQKRLKRGVKDKVA
jgi:hypothetical protein